MDYIKIPIDRIAVLIGKNGETKNKITKLTGLELDIDSKEGDVKIITEKCDPLILIKTKNIITAIGKGFSPENALKLLKEEMDLFVFDLHDFVGKKPTHVKRIKGRVIGKKGKTKRIIEELTNSKISVYGHTISAISSVINMNIVKKAILMILNGSKHATVYHFLEQQMKEIKKMERMGF